MTLLLIHFTCHVRGEILIVTLPDARFSETSTVHRKVKSKPSSWFKRPHKRVPLSLLDAGISRQILLVLVQSRSHVLDHPSCFCLTSTRVLLLQWGAPSWLGPSVGQTMVEESSLFIAERVPEPLQNNRGGRRAATKMDGL